MRNMHDAQTYMYMASVSGTPENIYKDQRLVCGYMYVSSAYVVQVY